jgi:hypothetical protein
VQKTAPVIDPVTNQTTTVTTTYVYDASGQLAAEYATPSTVSSCGTATCYVTVDHLGSTRMVTDSTGKVATRYDYLPFGGELLAGTGGRTTTMGYQPGADSFNPKYTGQMRDQETGLDYTSTRGITARRRGGSKGRTRRMRERILRIRRHGTGMRTWATVRCHTRIRRGSF